eukprot:2341024-Rhodomonas_salina.1
MVPSLAAATSLTALLPALSDSSSLRPISPASVEPQLSFASASLPDFDTSSPSLQPSALPRRSLSVSLTSAEPLHFSSSVSSSFLASPLRSASAEPQSSPLPSCIASAGPSRPSSLSDPGSSPLSPPSLQLRLSRASASFSALAEPQQAVVSVFVHVGSPSS